MLRIAENDLAQEAAQLLRFNSGLEVSFVANNLAHSKGFDGQFIIGETISLPIEIRKNLRRKQVKLLQEQLDDVPQWMLITDYLSRPMQEYLRQNRIFYLDLAGNAFLRLPGLLLSVKGEEKKKSESKGAEGSFSQAELRALFGLILQPGWVNHSYRQLEVPLQVGKATLSKLYQHLLAHDFLTGPPGEYQWQNWEKLCAAWIAAYEKKLRPQSLLGRFRFSKQVPYLDWRSWQMDTETRWSGEAAGELLTGQLIPGDWELYSQASPHQLIKQYHLIPDSEGPISVYRQFWQSECEPVPAHPAVVPAFLVYADLHLSRKTRATNLAQHLWSTYVGNPGR